ncbi:M23 family metallopeptidase [Streptomyces pinistramenti]|uniref:M23 family metallopeptidase n=1 Tax=Streptomyces pinistramenti TaxID=2884812 RepID=UPI001D0804DA|nr:peptidoglycan DD-metalloendopeptidase family protein [Streptomyces pinistramenti]MCB5911195.1 peptidoglycan DD-metalloendopeptidase family protein [Streptomyces pinistramenti]
MNDRHPSETPLPTGPAPDASYAHYPAYDSYGQQHTVAANGCAEYGGGDPLFGSLPGAYDTGQYGADPYATGSYGTAQHGVGPGTAPYGSDATGGYPAGAYDTGSFPATSYDTGTYGTGAYDTGAYGNDAYGAQPGGYDPYAHTAYEAPGHDTHGYAAPGYHPNGQETGAYQAATGPAAYGTGTYDTGAYDTGAYGDDDLGTGAYGTPGADEVRYDHGTAYGTGGYEATAVQEAVGHDATAVWPTVDQAPTATIPAQAGPPQADSGPPAPAGRPRGGSAAMAEALTQATPVVTAVAADTPEGPKAVRGRGRRRTAKRSALLTVAVPSVAAMGVCAVAAAAVGGFGGDEKDEAATQGAPDAGSVKPSAANNKLDTQLAGLSAGADDFADRASRTQERIDLKERQAAEKERKVKEAKRKEAERPKFLLPVKQHGLSALYGQAGVNWMSVHTGIDFPVSYGTPVMAATDGTVRTQWNSAYGNMAIVTAPDGTETWYCHLSSTKVRSGSVKAGDQIAYSGSSGNSTGPHMHFEVRPGGGSPIDPLPWLHSHGLNPN